jgi:hypothetical protein
MNQNQAFQEEPLNLRDAPLAAQRKKELPTKPLVADSLPVMKDGGHTPRVEQSSGAMNF